MKGMLGLCTTLYCPWHPDFGKARGHESIHVLAMLYEISDQMVNIARRSICSEDFIGYGTKRSDQIVVEYLHLHLCRGLVGVF